MTKEPLVTGLWVIFIFSSGFSKFSMMSQKTFIIRNYVVFFLKKLPYLLCVRRTGNIRCEWAHRGTKCWQWLRQEGGLKGRDLDNVGAGGGPAKKKDQKGPSWPHSPENLRDVPGWGKVA